MDERFKAGPDASIVVDNEERERWAEIGVADSAAQDRIFRGMAKAVASLTAPDETDWQPVSNPSRVSGKHQRSRDR